MGKFLAAVISMVLLSSLAIDKPRILIIGDSISIGYTPFVKKNMEENAEVFHNPGNAQHTGTGLEKIEEWLGDGQWDIVQFNWGLWDLCYRHPDSKFYGNRDKRKGEITFSVKQYASNLDSLVSIMRSKTNAELVFITTTFVPKDEAGRYKSDAVKYNIAAKEVMERHGVKVNDIYEASVSIHEEFGKGSADVHYSEVGYERLGVLISRFLTKEL